MLENFWENIINLMKANDQLRQANQGMEMQNMINNEGKIKIETEGDKINLTLKNVPKSFLSMQQQSPGQNIEQPPMQPNLNQMYNMQEPKKFEDLTLQDKAKMEASIKTAGLEPQEPEGGLMGMLKAIPIGGFKFDRRLGWGNVINAMTASVLGQHIIQEQYEKEKYNYERLKNELERQYMQQEIDMEQFKTRLKEAELKYKMIEETQKKALSPFSLKEWANAATGDEELSKNFEDFARMNGFGQKTDKGLMINNAELATLMENMKNVFPTGFSGWIELMYRNKMAGAKDEEERKKWQQKLDNWMKVIINPNMEYQYQEAEKLRRENIANFEEKQKIKNKYATMLENERQQGRIFLEQLRAKEKGSKEISQKEIDNQYARLLSLKNRLENEISQYRMDLAEPEIYENQLQSLADIKNQIDLIYPKTTIGKAEAVDETNINVKRAKLALKNWTERYLNGKTTPEEYTDAIKNIMQKYEVNKELLQKWLSEERQK